MINNFKVCPLCKMEKDINLFGKNSKSNDGLRYECKDCRRKSYYENHERILENKKKYYEKNKESLLANQRKHYHNNPDKFREKSRKNYIQNKEAILKQQKEYKLQNRESILKYKKEYEKNRRDKQKQEKLNKLITVNYPPEYKVCSECNTLKLIENNFNLCKGKRFEGKILYRAFCKECESLRNKAYRIKNGEMLRQKDRDFRKENPELAREIKRKKNNSEATKIRLKSPKNRILRNMHQYIKTALEEHGLKKNLKSKMLYLGCTREEFYNHIEKQFAPGMNWDNYGGDINNWSIDHYIPKEAFNILDPKEQEICFNYKNLQPLWHIDNEIKQDKMPDGTLARDTKNNYTLEDKINLINEKYDTIEINKKTQDLPCV